MKIIRVLEAKDREDYNCEIYGCINQADLFVGEWGCDGEDGEGYCCLKCFQKGMEEEQSTLNTEEGVIQATIIAARKIQDFLWSGINTGAGFEEFRRMLRKRLAKMDQISFENPYWKIEARKRLLQLAAISVQCIQRLQDPGFQGSNLHEYAIKIEEKKS